MKSEYDTCPRCKGRKLVRSRLCVHCKDAGAASNAWKGGKPPCPRCGGPKFRSSKQCRKCGGTKYDDEQHLTAAEKMRAYRQTPKGAAVIRNANLKSTHGITVLEYDAMVEAQGGVCAACNLPETHRNQHGPVRLAVDHNHETGAIRGLLCQRCNTSLGLLSDSPERIRGLLLYLENQEVMPYAQ